jgi:hypothetical protein
MKFANATNINRKSVDRAVERSAVFFQSRAVSEALMSPRRKAFNISVLIEEREVCNTPGVGFESDSRVSPSSNYKQTVNTPSGGSMPDRSEEASRLVTTRSVLQGEAPQHKKHVIC